MPVSAVDLPFAEQSEFLRRKLNLPTQAWTDIYTREHDWSFVVAGANRDAIVGDFREAIERAINDGETLEQFRKRFDEIVEQHGWSYNGGRNWRSRVIYETNLNQTYNAGRYQQLLDVAQDRPYWEYRHSDAVEHPRPVHESWDGLVLRYDDPWWQTHFPANGWGCQCRVFALSDDDLAAEGKAGPDTAPPIEYEEKIIGKRSPGGPQTVTVPQGVDPGFEYIPGQSRLHSATPPPGGGTPPGVPNTRPTDPLPTPRPSSAGRALPQTISDNNAAQAFLNEFGAADTPAIFRDVIGERLTIGRELFIDRVTSELTVPPSIKRNLLSLADTLASPDEIWTRIEWIPEINKAAVRRRYLAEFVIDNEALFVVLEFGRGGWHATTTANATQAAINAMRYGVRLYQREGE